MKKIVWLFLGIFLLLLVFSYVYAADYLNTSATGMLPSNPFYVLKEIWRGIVKFFIFNTVKRAEFELKILNEKAVELETVMEKDIPSSVDISKALLNYRDSLDSMTDHLVSLKNSSQNQDAEDLIKSVSGQLADDIKMLEYVQDKFKDQLDLNQNEIEDLKTDIRQSIKTLK